jgi:uncharacterized protein (DUF433 family)
MGCSPEEIADQYGHLTFAQIDAEMAAEEADYDRLAAAHRANRGSSR